MTEDHASVVPESGVAGDVEHGGVRELLRIAVPLALSTGTLSVMHVTDRVFLTWYHIDALAASLPASMLSWTLLSLAFGTIGYINTFVAQYYGAGRWERAGASVWQGIYLALAASLLFLPFVAGARWIFSSMGYEGNVLNLEVEYFQILGLGAAPALLNVAISCVYSGRGKTWAVFFVNSIAMIANFFLDWGLIFGRFGLPEMGVRGAALATITGSALSVLFWFVLLWVDPGVRPMAMGRGWRPDGVLLRRILYYGIPNGLMMFLEAGLFNVLLLIIGQMGKVELAATNLAFTLNTLAFIPIFGLQTAVIVLVGQRIGEKRPDIAAKTTGRAILVSNVYMSIWASLYVIFPDLVLQIFAWHSDPEEFRTTRELSLILLRFVAAYTIFDGWQLIYGGAVRGAGDTRVSLLFFIGSQLMVMVLPVWVGWRFYGQGILFAWTWLTLWVVVLAAGFYLRFHAGHWRSMNVIEPVVLDDDDATDDARPALSQERVPV